MQPQPPGGYGQGPYNPNMNPNMQQQGQFQHQQFQPGMAPPMPYHMQQQQPMYYPPNYQQARPVHNGHQNMIQNQNMHQPPQWQPDQVSISSAVRDINAIVRIYFLPISFFLATLNPIVHTLFDTSSLLTSNSHSVNVLVLVLILIFIPIYPIESMLILLRVIMHTFRSTWFSLPLTIIESSSIYYCTLLCTALYSTNVPW